MYVSIITTIYLLAIVSSSFLINFDPNVLNGELWEVSSHRKQSVVQILIPSYQSLIPGYWKKSASEV